MQQWLTFRCPVVTRFCQVVWAKVEGHDWWPAKVVRRRAVPREVGPPPSLPGASIATYLPVIFFTEEGIPGEASAAGDEDDAEYAWLTRDLVKPFWSEDGGDVSADPGLQACVTAAEAAIEVRLLRPRLHVLFLGNVVSGSLWLCASCQRPRLGAGVVCGMWAAWHCHSQANLTSRHNLQRLLTYMMAGGA